ncbi:hypothetical protein B0H14DRAFT_3430035 [Mycena olivaceomarginata]|nr:hypothetical protein B0H14DRAFT_3430035 [Mycena olivaceomarginata]
MSAAPITVTVHDTVVFFAISYRLLGNTHVEHTQGEIVKGAASRREPARIFEGAFADGKKYYMITVVSNILLTSICFAPGISPIYRAIFPVPNIALTSIMACRVYRNAMLHCSHNALSLPAISDYSVTTNANAGFAIPLSTLPSAKDHLKMVVAGPMSNSVYDLGLSSNTE